MITRKQEWFVAGGVMQRHFPYGGYTIRDEDSIATVKAALIEQGEVSAFQHSGVWGIGKNSNGTYEGEFVRYLVTRDWFKEQPIEFAVLKATEWLEMGKRDW